MTYHSYGRERCVLHAIGWAGMRGRVKSLLAAYRASLRSRQYATATLNAPEIRYEVVPVFTTDGARLRVHVYGPPDGPTIVLIHGWSCCIEYWHPQINAFADQYRVVCYDQRGHGESETGTAAPSTDQLADDLATVLAATLRPGERAVLAGHSMGGITVQAWAARYPDQVTRRASAVVLANTTSGGIVRGTDLLPGFTSPIKIFGIPIKLPTRIAVVALGLPVPLPGGPLVKWIVRTRVMSPRATPDEVSFVLDIVRSCPPRSRARVERMLAEFDLGPAAENLLIPTTVIAGSFDHLLPVRLSEPMVEALTRVGSLVAFRILPAGHTSNVEAADLFNAELSNLLRHTATGPSATAG